MGRVGPVAVVRVGLSLVSAWIWNHITFEAVVCFYYYYYLKVVTRSIANFHRKYKVNQLP